MKKLGIAKLGILLTIGATALVACVPQQTPAPAPTEVPAEQPTDMPASTEAPTEAASPTDVPATETSLRWRTRPDNKEEADVYAGISEQVSETIGVALSYEPGGTEGANYQDQLKTEIAAGTAPDVFWIPGTDVADFATRGLILNAADLAAASGMNPEDFYAGPMAHLSYNPETGKSGADSGAVWGLPRDVSTFALYLNMDLIEEAGAPNPIELAKEGKWDWDAFVEVASATRALGSDIYGYGANAWWGPYGVWMNAAGGGFFNADRTACNLNSEESLTGLAFEQSLYQDLDLAVPYGEDSEPPFRAGKVAMFQNGRWATPGVRTVDFNWDVVELPAGPSGTAGNWLFWGAYVINANTQHPEEAWQLVQALTQADIQAQVSASGANIPSRVSQEAFDAFLTFTPPSNNQAFLNGIAADANPSAEGPLWAGSWPEFAKVMDARISALMTGQETIDDFSASVCDEANKAFGGQ
ncbi:MAG TPA: extracellular solute-binding protein [Anaerolineales bacterium]|nr:extracellular solute-binding protein [Anaerolineales bacterium]